ncbi:MAG: glycosyltransferase family 2 protein [Chloroflexota bacterium]
MAAYNEEDSVGDCLLSLQRQTFKPMEILVIDDGSKDRTEAICRASGIRVLRQNHRGPGAARNLGARIARGNILVISDADMTFEEHYVEKLVSPIVEGKAVATVGWDEYVANWENPWARCQCFFENLPERRRLSYQCPRDSDVFRAIRKDIFLEVGGFEEDKGKSDDKSIYYRTGLKAIVVNGVICHHKNASTAREVFNDALWIGKDLIYSNGIVVGILRLGWNNPVNNVLKGVFKGVAKRERYLPIYGLIYSVGLNCGFFQALVTGKHHK